MKTLNFHFFTFTLALVGIRCGDRVVVADNSGTHLGSIPPHYPHGTYCGLKCLFNPLLTT